MGGLGELAVVGAVQGKSGLGRLLGAGEDGGGGVGWGGEAPMNPSAHDRAVVGGKGDDERSGGCSTARMAQMARSARRRMRRRPPWPPPESSSVARATRRRWGRGSEKDRRAGEI